MADKIEKILEAWDVDMDEHFTLSAMVAPMMPFAMKRYCEMQNPKVIARMAAIATVHTGLRRRGLTLSHKSRQAMVDELIELILKAKDKTA